MSTKESKTVRVQFLSDEGKSVTVTSTSVNPALEEAGGKEIAQSVVDKLMEVQPFSRTLAEFKTLEIVDRKVNKIL